LLFGSLLVVFGLVDKIPMDRMQKYLDHSLVFVMERGCRASLVKEIHAGRDPSLETHKGWSVEKKKRG
jgi:hypothetical protein